MEIRGSAKAEGLRIGIVFSRFNDDVTSRLVQGAVEALEAAGVPEADRLMVSVPGAFEIPGAAQQLAAGGRVDAIVTLGAVIRGDTEHFTFVAGAAQQGVLRVMLDTGIPVTFGVLTTDDVEQAMERAGGEWGNKGFEATESAIEMANLYRELQKG